MTDVTIRWHTAVEALEAMEKIQADRSSYIHQRYMDDIAMFVAALEDLRRAIQAAKDAETQAK